MRDRIELFDEERARKIAKLYLPVIETYHRAKWIGLENIPDHVFLGVGNHTAMHFMPESFLWLAKYHSQHRPVKMLTLIHHMMHQLTSVIGLPVNELGFLEASRENALTALRAGYAVTVYPGGDRDVSRPFSDRHNINFFDHLGYVKMALRAQVPILPIVGCGGGETAIVLNSGNKIAEWTGLKKWAKIHTWPLYWSFPFGLHLGHIPHFEIPIPTQVTMSVLKPFSVSHFEPEDANNPDIVRHINEDVVDYMQTELTRLAKNRIPFIG